MTFRVVADLEVQSPLHGLEVGDARFGFNSIAPWPRFAPSDLAIPGSQITLDPERNLGSPSQGWVQTLSQSFKEGQLGSVADRITGWVRAEGEVQAHDRAPCAELRNRHSDKVAAFETQELLVRRVRRGTHVPKTQPGANAREAVLQPKAANGLPSSTASSIGRSLASSHHRHDRQRALSADLPALGPLVGPTDERTAWMSATRVTEWSRGPLPGPSREGDARIRHWNLEPAGSIARWSAGRTRHACPTNGAGAVG